MISSLESPLYLFSKNIPKMFQYFSQMNSGLKILQFQKLQKGASEGHQDKIISINSTQIIFLHEQCANFNSKKLAFEAFASYYGAKIKSI